MSSPPHVKTWGDISPPSPPGFTPLIPIPKKGNGSMNDIRNYRGIALSSLLSKLFDHCIICNQYDSLRSDDLQFAYRSKRVQPTRGWTVAAQRSTNCTHSSCPPQWGPVSTVFWAGRPSGPAGWLALLLLKAGDVETNPGPKHTRTQVWICDICHREITRKQTSLRCNHSEHWVHLRCAHIRVDQYTDTWICHLHRGSRLPHATHTSPHFPLASSKPLLHSPPTPPTPPHPKHQHTSNSPMSPPKMTNPRLPKPLTHSPPTPPTPPPAKQIHISHKTPSPSTTPRTSITTRTSNAAERPVPVSSSSATNTQVTLNTTIATPTATALPTQTQHSDRVVPNSDKTRTTRTAHTQCKHHKHS